jgi:hypothetical protein
VFITIRMIFRRLITIIITTLIDDTAVAIAIALILSGDIRQFSTTCVSTVLEKPVQSWHKIFKPEIMFIAILGKHLTLLKNYH